MGTYLNPGTAEARREESAPCSSTGELVQTGTGTGRSPAERAERHAAVSAALTTMDDERLMAMLRSAPRRALGIGGHGTLVDVGGVAVWVKQVPLTAIEQGEDVAGSTANTFGLPTFFHYGLGSVGAGAWREVAAHDMATEWALEGKGHGVALLHHSRVLPLPRGDQQPWADRSELDTTVEFWHNSSAVRERLTALAAAPATIALFMEYQPETLHTWLAGQCGPDRLEAALDMVERELLAIAGLLRHNGMVHFDTHFENILTDGHRLYLTDFGLASASRFDLSAAERSFLRRNDSHDVSYVVTQLVNWLVTEFAGTTRREDRVDYVRQCAHGDQARRLPAPAAAIVERYAPIAAVLNDFYSRLLLESRAIPYPATTLDALCAGLT
ncbi:hypothetical protein ABZ639_05595 [Saccharomonospora sp. NPDC006951]